MSKKLTLKRKKYIQKRAKQGMKDIAKKKRYNQLRKDPDFQAAQVEKFNLRADSFYKNFQALFLDPFNKKNNTDLQINPY